MSDKQPRPSMVGAIEHKCHDCMSGYADGHKDCERVKCALYFWMPYRKLEPVMSWTEYSSRQTGYEVGKGRTYTPEQRAAAANRLKSWRSAHFAAEQQAEANELAASADGELLP